MKLLDVLLISLAAVFIIIGIYEVMSRGLAYAYLPLMLSMLLFFVFSFRKKKAA